MKSLFIVGLGVLLGASAPLRAQDALATPQTATDTAPINWKIRLLAGQKFRTTVDTSSQMVMPIPTFPGMPAQAPSQTESNSLSHIVFDQNVLSSDENGAQIELIYRESTQKTVIAQNGVPDEKSTKNLADIGRNLVGVRLSYRLSSNGKVSDVQGVEEYVARMLPEANENQTEQQRQLNDTMRSSMKAALSQSALEDLIGESFGTLPDAPIAPGKSWTVKIDSPAVMGLKTNETGTRTFVGREAGLVLIRDNTVISSDPDKKLEVPLPANANARTPVPSAKVAMNGTSRGETRVDETTGMVFSSRSNQQMRTVTTMENVDGKGGKLEMTMDMTSEKVSTTELLETETNKTP